MRLLLISDTQTEYSNLDLCAISIQELIAAAKKYKPDAIIHCGDVKEHYLHAELVWVAKFWIKAIREIKEAGFRFIILLGNHDRLSQSPDSKNWFDILRAAGAETVSLPRWKKIGDGHVAFLPYTANKKQEKKWAFTLADTHRDKRPSALILHTELRGAILNSSGMKAEGLDSTDLYLDRYDVCLGGHLHQHQKVGDNAYYVGSPFCMDWNEANTIKGHVLVDITDDGYVTLSQLRTKIPGWYDAEKITGKVEQGSHIRARIPVTSKKITDQIKQEEARLAKLYPGTNIFVIPKLEQAADAEIQLEGVSDEEQVAKYVAYTLKEGVRFKAKQLVGYLTSKLGATNAPRPGKGQLRFLDFKGINVLSYPEVQIKYTKQGLVLLKGVNRDWPKQSNGCGKTNALSMLPIGMFGETLKGQSNDEWAREDTKEKAIGILRIKDGRGRILQIERERRKHAIRLIIDGDDKSSGLTGKEKTGTQGIIERETGFDMNMLLNSVYIDQSIANGFVFGKQAARMKLVEKLCNLERYEAALKLVSKDIDTNNKEQASIAAKLDNAEQDAVELMAAIKELEPHIEVEWEKQRVEADKKVKLLHKAHTGLGTAVQFYEDLQIELNNVVAAKDVIKQKLSSAAAVVYYWQRERKERREMVDAGKCPRCNQSVMGIATAIQRTARMELESAQTHFDKLLKSEQGAKQRETEIATQLQKYRLAVKDNERDLAEARRLLAQAEQGAREEAKRNERIELRKQDVQLQLKKVQRLIKALQSRITDLSIDREMLEEAKAAFHRSGMPLYLASALCPLLNNAANEFSDVFFQGKTRVQFEVNDGEFLPWIVNPNGSKTLKGQSVGEAAMAGIIAAFSVREAAPKTNLLVIDEPGHGLDPVGATQFAKGLLYLKDKYETIIVTTHSPYIEAVLNGEKIWTVEKRKGQSRLLTDVQPKP